MFVSEVPNTDQTINLHQHYKFAFLAQNYWDKSVVYDDTSLVSWVVYVYEGTADGNEQIAHTVDVH